MAFFKLAHLKLDQPEMHKCMQIFFKRKKEVYMYKYILGTNYYVRSYDMG